MITILNVPQNSEPEKLIMSGERNFDAVAKAFPNYVAIVGERRSQTAYWGSAFYVKGEDGNIVCTDSNYDSSG